jgi:hypothetical protein
MYRRPQLSPAFKTIMDNERRRSSIFINAFNRIVAFRGCEYFRMPSSAAILANRKRNKPKVKREEGGGKNNIGSFNNSCPYRCRGVDY